MEPVLLVPIGIGVLLVNLPMAGMMVYNPEGFPVAASTFGEMLHLIMKGEMGLLNVVYAYGIETEIIPLLIFLGVGAMTDFRPAIGRPISFLYGATAQMGVFVVFFIAYVSGMFTVNEAAAVGIIGGSDGPPTVYLTAVLAPQILGPVTMVAYSYMALVPILQPRIIRLLTTKKERAIFMKPQIRKVSDLEAILFPIIIFVVAALLVPKSTPLIGMFMFGNLLRVSGVTDRLADVVSGELINILTILLGVTVGALMPAEVFLNTQTLAIIGLAIVAFSFSTAGGLHAMGPNMAGAIATSVVAGVFLGMLM
jgi:oxaloacetate decarboxylase beta subunit